MMSVVGILRHSLCHWVRVWKRHQHEGLLLFFLLFFPKIFSSEAQSFCILLHLWLQKFLYWMLSTWSIYLCIFLSHGLHRSKSFHSQPIPLMEETLLTFWNAFRIWVFSSRVQLQRLEMSVVSPIPLPQRWPQASGDHWCPAAGGTGPMQRPLLSDEHKTCKKLLLAQGGLLLGEHFRRVSAVVQAARQWRTWSQCFVVNKTKINIILQQ